MREQSSRVLSRMAELGERISMEIDTPVFPRSQAAIQRAWWWVSPLTFCR